MPVTTEQAAVLMEVYKKQQYLGSGDVQSLITKTGLFVNFVIHAFASQLTR